VSEKHHEPALRKDKGFNVLSEAYKEREKEKGRENRAKIANTVVEALFIRGFDREQEFDADRHGAVIAARAGYDPYGLASFLQTLSSISPTDNAIRLMKSTHPEPKDRLNKLMQSMDGRLDKYSVQARLEDRYKAVMEAHMKAMKPN
jgi:predicted Zn-dependent protease